MTKTKIDFADYTWNPAWGCRNHCPYCYARAMAHRWGKSFEPHWMERNFNSPMPKEPSRIFVDSMSDVMYWELDWWLRVLARIAEYPQHTFLFLTQDPREYWVWHDRMPRNCWLGATATGEWKIWIMQERMKGLSEDFLTFLSIEPMLEKINPELIDPKAVRWVILAAETGNRPEKVVPPAEWIQPFLELEIPLYMKRNLPWTGPWRKEFPA
jgi:protein gp37